MGFMTRKHGISNLTEEDMKSLEKIQNLSGEKFLEKLIGLGDIRNLTGMKTHQKMQIILLTQLVEQNWMIIRELKLISEKIMDDDIWRPVGLFLVVLQYTPYFQYIRCIK